VSNIGSSTPPDVAEQLHPDPVIARQDDDAPHSKQLAFALSHDTTAIGPRIAPNHCNWKEAYYFVAGTRLAGLFIGLLSSSAATQVDEVIGVALGSYNKR
jgi:hypothetical protein